ncbi:MAG: NAD(+)/NADH kinase [Deltaproteobacteria bacterium]|jgi:predicted polyphosphate/ATP-dependent NAD kinase|nr:NAD(+)/NADH kinase [Deltaproteobacteria bacterium]MBW2237525.1 NAD(+)/NADH kinase [Deltaproteobacteria bacterium]MBW2571006.1 NAD(+)/NADH kinase [Deltaproteobacteria bacterium]MBW2668891.1 NAD(+)/NADH kinase [Deltaproteobacteria bacterium]MBW2710430.1 NAD(+)/NADH kinase [Deltaproteobacteria bacterium]
MSLVGIIANPASGTDIRRLVAYGSVFSNQEKVRILRRILIGLEATGVQQIRYMPDYYGIVDRALNGLKIDVDISPLSFDTKADQRDSTRAAEILAENGADCIITIGGDGTNRVVAKGAGQIPILPVSTGTNNVFPYMIEGTIAGLAAGLIATGKISCKEGTFTSTRLEVVVEGQLADIAIVDALVCDDIFIGSRAVWKIDKIRQVFLNRSSPASIGFSSIGGMLRSIAPNDPFSMVLELGKNGQLVTAPIAPGVVEIVSVENVQLMAPGEEVDIVLNPCVVALDGEREVEIKRGRKAAIRLSTDGPLVVDVERTMAFAMRNKILAPEYGKKPVTFQNVADGFKNFEPN